MYTYNIFAYLYFKSTKFYLSFYLSPPLRSFSLVWFQFFMSRFLLFLFFPQSFYAADTRIYAFHATVFIVGLVSFRVLLSFFFSHFIIHYFLTYPYLCDSLWSIIVTTSRMISRRRSASLSLPLPRISWWRIIRTIMKISTLFHPLALSLSFTSRLRSFSVFVFHAFWIVFKGTCIVNYKYRQRDAVAPSSRLFFHHIVVVVAVARRFSFCSFAFFSPFCLNFEQS